MTCTLRATWASKDKFNVPCFTDSFWYCPYSWLHKDRIALKTPTSSFINVPCVQAGRTMVPFFWARGRNTKKWCCWRKSNNEWSALWLSKEKILHFHQSHYNPSAFVTGEQWTMGCFIDTFQKGHWPFFLRWLMQAAAVVRHTSTLANCQWKNCTEQSVHPE